MGRGGLGGGTEESETQTEPVTQPTLSSQAALVVKNLPAHPELGALTCAAAGGLAEPSWPLSPLAGGTWAPTVAA